MNYVQYPVTFMGQDTGLVAPSMASAAIKVWYWLARGNGPEIPSEYKPVMPCYSTIPTMGRLKKNTQLMSYPPRIEVGLGLPDRRQRKKAKT